MALLREKKLLVKMVGCVANSLRDTRHPGSSQDYCGQQYCVGWGKGLTRQLQPVIPRLSYVTLNLNLLYISFLNEKNVSLSHTACFHSES